MCATYLLIEMACVYKQNFIVSITILFGSVEKPEGTGQGDGIEEI